MPKQHDRKRKRVLVAAVGLALCQLGGFVVATPGATRRLQEDAGQTKFRVADFSGLSADGSNETEIQLPEKQLSGIVNVSGNGSGVALYGSYPLGAAQVQQLAKALSDEEVRIQLSPLYQYFVLAPSSRPEMRGVTRTTEAIQGTGRCIGNSGPNNCTHQRAQH